MEHRNGPPRLQVLENLRASCALNSVSCEVRQLTWGLQFWHLLDDAEPPDIVLAADVLYDSADFEDFFVTLRLLLGSRLGAAAMIAYQHRSSHRSIEFLMAKWGLTCASIVLADDFMPPSKLESLKAAAVEVVELVVDNRAGIGGKGGVGSGSSA
eukprot:SM000026S08970  [mRNA]  locus=s26:794061:795394:+ [translate_table: standard]